MDAITPLTEEGKIGDPRRSESCSKAGMHWERGAIRAYLVDGSMGDAVSEEGCSTAARRPGILLGLWGLVSLVGRRRSQRAISQTRSELSPGS